MFGYVKMKEYARMPASRILRIEGSYAKMKIYTKTGDEGQTSVIGGRVSKDDIRVEAYGTVDELNCFVGQAAVLCGEELFGDVQRQLLQIQQELFDCGSDLAFAGPKGRGYKVQQEQVQNLELWMDDLETENPPLEKFILPGGSALAAALHVCRTVCRRAERRAVTLAGQHGINPEVQKYLNRLSDYFFIAARLANTRAGVPETEYARGRRVFR